MTHVKHLGFNLELKVMKIIAILAEMHPDDRLLIINQLAPIGLKRAVGDHYGIDL